jgi:hypothetical protein
VKTVLFTVAAIATLIAAAHQAAAQDTETKNAVEVFKSRAEVINAEAQNKQANAAIINAQAVYMKSHAESQKLHQETREKSAQNDLLETKVFYDKRGMYHAYKEAHKAKASTPEQHASRAAQAAPDRMSNAQLWIKPGYVRWPSMLRQADYAKQRGQIDGLFAQRSPDDSGAGSQNCVELQAQIDGLKTVLASKVRQYKPADYLAAKKFLEALAVEAQYSVDNYGQLASK